MDTIDFNLELEKWKAQIDKTSIARLPDSDFNLNEIKQFYMGITEWEENNPIWNLIFWLNSFEYRHKKKDSPVGVFSTFFFDCFSPLNMLSPDKDVRGFVKSLKFQGNSYTPIFINPYFEVLYICISEDAMDKPVIFSDNVVTHIIYDNPLKMIQSINHCFAEDVYVIRMGDKGFKFIDHNDDTSFEKEHEIAEKLNPSATYWSSDDY